VLVSTLWLVLLWTFVIAATVRAQAPAPEPSTKAEGGGQESSGMPAPSSPEERLKFLTDPEALKKKINEKEKTKPPIEFFRSQIAPFDILPYIKANHWSTLSLEARANYDDYVGLIQSEAVPLLGMPREMVYRRDARLIKTQRSRLSLQMLLPRIPKEMSLELIRPEAIRADEVWQASLRTLEPHQMLVLVLTKGTNDSYSQWNRFQAMHPSVLDRGDPVAMDALRYYRLVLPLEPAKPPLSPHPLTWTTISHVLWDAMAPENLNPSQQQAMLDWLHWGGQLILMGGATPSFSLLRDSFLGPYLPADATGQNVLLNQEGLMPMALAYPPPNDPQETEVGFVPNTPEEALNLIRRYKAPEPIRPASNRPVFLAGLEPKLGASRIPLGESSEHTLGVEWRVGRGRVLMLALNPTDPALAAWPGLDTFVRRVILRRPEDYRVQTLNANTAIPTRHTTFEALSGPDLTWVRFLSRDLGASANRPEPYLPPRPSAGEVELATPGPLVTPGHQQVRPPGSEPVAEWLDSSALPRLSRDLFEEASGITIPSSSFVLKVILAYILALVPLNWLVCRYVFGRREWAWLVVPILALGFAVGVERAAAYDMGYDIACDEFDVVEAFGGYHQAHVSRFASLYSTGRVRFSISYPNDPTALALPLDDGRALRGEDVATSVWQSYPIPTLQGFEIQPRSVSMFRAEQMTSLAGSVKLVTDEGRPRIVNETDLQLRDAVVIDVGDPKHPKETYVGTIEPGSAVELKAVPRAVPEPLPKNVLEPEKVLSVVRSYVETRAENQGEIRLVAWARSLVGGQKLEPTPDRHRGFTAIVIHLRQGPPPAPDGPRYNILALGPEQPPEGYGPEPEHLARPSRARVRLRLGTPSGPGLPLRYGTPGTPNSPRPGTP
jgi:hypothetical protein